MGIGQRNSGPLSQRVRDKPFPDIHFPSIFRRYTVTWGQGKCTVSTVLTNEDWDRIVFALSHFSHNTEFQETLKRVLIAREQRPN